MGPAPVVRTRLGISMLLRAPFDCSFVLERPDLTASVGPAAAGGCSGGPFQQFFVVVVLKASGGPIRLLNVTVGPIWQQFCFEGIVLTA